jgi:hypothetical protein
MKWAPRALASPYLEYRGGINGIEKEAEGELKINFN